LKVKICGITNLDDARYCEKNGADALGFIFYEKSRRYIAPDRAAKIISGLSPFTVKVGVFVNTHPQDINKIAGQIKLNAVQLHGDETPEQAAGIDYPVIKSFRIKEQFDFRILNYFKNVSFLLDSYSGDGYGGTGRKFNWHLIPHELNGSFILAGGISTENIEEIFNSVKPKAVDVSSSLEKLPGIKDHKKVKDFFNKINLLRS